jgi:hypothetical protein
MARIQPRPTAEAEVTAAVLKGMEQELMLRQREVMRLPLLLLMELLEDMKPILIAEKKLLLPQVASIEDMVAGVVLTDIKCVIVLGKEA